MYDKDKHSYLTHNIKNMLISRKEQFPFPVEISSLSNTIFITFDYKGIYFKYVIRVGYSQREDIYTLITPITIYDEHIIGVGKEYALYDLNAIKDVHNTFEYIADSKDLTMITNGKNEIKF